jgi:squalene-hopene/tetraprenyl-beta-curcumene cyclase
MIQRFEGSDGLAAIFPAMLNSLIALKALGYPDDHPADPAPRGELKKLSTKPPTASASNLAPRRCGTPPS